MKLNGTDPKRKRNQADATLRNVRAAHKRDKAEALTMRTINNRLDKIEGRLARLEC